MLPLQKKFPIEGDPWSDSPPKIIGQGKKCEGKVRNIPVVIPGIMGSTLTYGNLTDRRPLTLWSGDIRSNYGRLLKDAGILRWNGNRAAAEVIEHFTISFPIQILGQFELKRAIVWGRVLNWLQQHPAFDGASPVLFGYDWRAPLQETSRELCLRLAEAVRDEVSDPWRPTQGKFSIFAHSMGGIVALLAIGQELLHPSRLDRVVFIGSPLRGAPSAFSAAYETVHLPLFREIFGLFHANNMALFYRNLLECIRTFPSIYSLFPSEEIPYLYYGPSSRSNPLREEAMSPTDRRTCLETHRNIEKGMRLLEITEVPTHTIYTEVNSHRKTDLEYRVTPHAPGYGYSIEETISKTLRGDGTVPSDSACGSRYMKRQTVTNVDHAFLCNDEKVVECLTTLIPQARSYAS